MAKLSEREIRMLAEALVWKALYEKENKSHFNDLTLEVCLEHVCCGIVTLTDKQTAEVIRVAKKVNPCI